MQQTQIDIDGTVQALSGMQTSILFCTQTLIRFVQDKCGDIQEKSLILDVLHNMERGIAVQADAEYYEELMRRIG